MAPLSTSRPASAAALLLAALSCAPPPPAPPAPADAEAVARELLADANLARAQARAPALRPHPALMRAARAYSRELARRGELDHFSRRSGRRTPLERIRAAGAAVGPWAENLARAERLPGDVPIFTVVGWLQSPRHRASLLDPRFRFTGIGVAPAKDGSWYVVQLYAAPPPSSRPGA